MRQICYIASFRIMRSEMHAPGCCAHLRKQDMQQKLSKQEKPCHDHGWICFFTKGAQKHHLLQYTRRVELFSPEDATKRPPGNAATDLKPSYRKYCRTHSNSTKRYKDKTTNTLFAHTHREVQDILFCGRQGPYCLSFGFTAI